GVGGAAPRRRVFIARDARRAAAARAGRADVPARVRRRAAGAGAHARAPRGGRARGTAHGRAGAAAAGLDRGVRRRAARRRVPLAVRTLPLARAAAPRRRRARARAGRRAGRVAAGRVRARDCILPAGARAGRAGGGAVRRGRLRGAARRRPSASPLSGASEGRLYRRRAGARAGSPMRAPGPGMRRTSVGGFTLVELLVALAVAGIVALAAQQLLAT